MKHFFADRVVETIEYLALGMLGGVMAALFIAMVCALAGCQSAAVKQAIAQSQVQAAQVKAKNAVDVAKVNARAKLKNAKASESPTSHPFTSMDQTVKHFQTTLEIIALAAGVAFAVFLGLTFTSLSAISKIALPVSASVATLSFVGAIALPFTKWVMLAGAVLIVGLCVYEIIRYKSIRKAAAAIEADLGISGATASAAEAAAAKSIAPAIKAIGAALHVATPAGMT